MSGRVHTRWTFLSTFSTFSTSATRTFLSTFSSFSSFSTSATTLAAHHIVRWSFVALLENPRGVEIEKQKKKRNTLPPT